MHKPKRQIQKKGENNFMCGSIFIFYYLYYFTYCVQCYCAAPYANGNIKQQLTALLVLLA